NMFSTITDVPFATVKAVTNIDCMSVGKPGYGIVFISTAFNLLGVLISIVFFVSLNLQPASSSLCITGVIHVESMFFSIMFPFVIADKHKNVPASILSGIML